MNRKLIGLSLLLLIAGSVSFLSFSDRDFKLVKNLEIFHNLFRELNLFYVDETDPRKLIEKGIEGMLNSLDPYTMYIPEKERENFDFMTTGKYGGIGAVIRSAGDYVIIAEPYEGFPAANNDVHAGDTIISIDGKSMKGKNVSQVSEMLKGKPGTSVEIEFARTGKAGTMTKELVREQISIKNVPYYAMIDDSVGYILLNGFKSGAFEETRAVFLELKKEHNVQALILDLRSNPGGLLPEAVDVSSMFIDKGEEVVSTRGKIKEFDYTYRTRYMPLDKDIPLVVLVNRGSASASEIVAGVMQDLDRGVIVGQRTFGKGLVQTTRELIYNTQLKVTTAKYYIPSGRCIQALDYSNRNEDGSVGNIPDSLISAFETRNGRTVYDGGGIRPDKEAASHQYGQITQMLYARGLIFDFANLFAAENDNIPPVPEYEVSDQTYSDFKNYVISSDFTYETRSERKLDELKKVAREEKYYALAGDKLEELSGLLSHNNKRDLALFEEEIRELLEEEISSRYYLMKGRIMASLESDPQLDEALEIIKNPDKYKHILQPQEAVLQAMH